jgi:hypothetical protein
MVNLWAGVVKEGMVDILIDVELNRLPSGFELSLKLSTAGGGTVRLAETQDRASNSQCRTDIGMYSVVHDTGTHRRVGTRRIRESCPPMQNPAMPTDFGIRNVEQVVNASTQVLRHLSNVQAANSSPPR